MSDFIPDIPDPEGEAKRPRISVDRTQVLTVLFGLWLVALTLFFLLRLAFAVYFDHREAINELMGW